MNISVIVPSYNRANLLATTLPTYIQDNVTELIVVDDCSTDDTENVVAGLQKKYPLIRYVRNKVNSKQPYSNNVGIRLAKGDYVYFGDDDSILLSGSMAFLKETLEKNGADICGAKALYLPLKYKEHVDEYVKLMDVCLPSGEKVADIKKIKTKFNYSVPIPVEVPFCQACALMKKELALKILFDVNYTGNAYREETDFFLRCSLEGARILYDSRAVQVNLPRETVSGGAHSMGRVRWYINTIQNNWYFLKKNAKAIQAHYGFYKNIYWQQFIFTLSMLKGGLFAAYKLLLRKII